MDGTEEKKILFISHEASRTGAPFVLLYLLQWLKQNTDYQIDLLLLNDGPIKGEFEKAVNEVFLLSEVLYEHPLKQRIKRKLKFDYSEERDVKIIGEKIIITSYDLVYGNTIACLRLLINLKKMFHIKVINAIHELRSSMEFFYSSKYLSDNLININLIIAGSQAVANDLTKRYNISSNIIKVIHAYINTQTKPSETKYILEEENVPKGRFILGGAGNIEWRKGTDLLIFLGLYFKKHKPDFDFHILWVGGNLLNVDCKKLLIDIEKSGLSDRITIVGNTNKYLDYINEFDVFTMLSREDPFPLVSLEASFLEKPIVMFKGSGGTEELMINGGGEIVPYLDIEGYCEAIYNLSKDEKLRIDMGKILKNEVIEKYNSDVSCLKVLAIFREML